MKKVSAFVSLFFVLSSFIIQFAFAADPPKKLENPPGEMTNYYCTPNDAFLDPITGWKPTSKSLQVFAKVSLIQDGPKLFVVDNSGNFILQVDNAQTGMKAISMFPKTIYDKSFPNISRANKDHPYVLSNSLNSKNTTFQYEIKIIANGTAAPTLTVSYISVDYMNKPVFNAVAKDVTCTAKKI